uniref:Photosystem II reaction center protein Z n=2 Tax=Euglena gracilis TaxID=3039 RepID=PSBZ_EUGGR|nr:Ycf9 [Euglena gracilis]P32095.1 RecName: Full=Photosystem II reaction center protein Z; Short=PSII-Z [Euglena gracilis]AKL82386.1 photosystem II protein Z [Euglena gracilis var. bacillaris]CAA50118.1 Ycf9 protein [Euglena gracilis]
MLLFTFTFQALVLALIIFSFILVLTLPVIFASPKGWENNKSRIWLACRFWFFLVFLIGILDGIFL